MTWWHADFDRWVDDTRSAYGSCFSADTRFIGADRLLKEFDSAAETWRRRRDPYPAEEKANELAAATALLCRLRASDVLHYEPPLKGTKKRIDFKITGGSAETAWIEVKTVAPRWEDDEKEWQRFLSMQADAPDNVHVIVNKDFGGAGITGQARKTRWSFLHRAVEVERKLKLLDASEQASVALLLCSNGFAWSEDALEDFADFYRTGRFRGDDWFSHAVVRFMHDRQMTLDRSLAGFHYLERKQFEVDPHEFIPFVRGPTRGS